MIVNIYDTFYQIDNKVELVKKGQYVLYRRKIAVDEYVYEKRFIIQRYSDNSYVRKTNPINWCTINAVLQWNENYFRITGQWKIKSQPK